MENEEIEQNQESGGSPLNGGLGKIAHGGMAEFINILRKARKPDCRFIERGAVKTLQKQDCLSISATVFRNGGRSGNGEAVAFVELTPELMALLKAIYA